MNTLFRRVSLLLVSSVVLVACGVADRATPTPLAESRAILTTIPMLSPTPSIQAATQSTSTAAATSELDDLKLTPNGEVEPIITVLPSDEYHLGISAFRTSNITLSTSFAPLIFIGTIQDVGVARWITPDGQRPADPHAPNNKTSIFRPVTITVERVLKGS